MTDADKISADQIKKMRAEFERAIQSVRDSVRIAELERLIAARDIDAIIELLGLDRATFAPLEQAINESYRIGGDYAAQILSPIPVPGVGSVAMRFDMSAPAAVQWLATNSSQLVVEIAEQQRQMIRERLADFTARGVNPRTAALDLVGRVDKTSGKRIGGFVGLTSQQAGWVANARSELESLDANYFSRALRDKRFDPAVKAAIKAEKPLTASQINAMITSMQNRTLKYRGDVISRNEAIKALRAGQYQAIRQAMGKGQIDEQDISKDWDATGDTRTREDHLLIEGQKRSFSAPFTFPDGSVAQYPGDDSLGAPGSQTIQCRCKAVYRIDFIGRAVRMQGFR